MNGQSEEMMERETAQQKTGEAAQSGRGAQEASVPSNKRIDEAYAQFVAQQNNNRIESSARTFFAVLIGSVIIALNMNCFINEAGLVPGGANGIVVLTQRIALTFFGIRIPFTPISVIANAVPAYLAFKTVGKKFTLFSCLCILLMSFLTDLVPAHTLTDDRLLMAVFAGIINGAAISLVLNAGASTGGSDFVAMYFSVKKGISTWNYVLMFNAVMILTSGVLFGMESALYTIIFQFCQTQVLNTAYKRYAKKTVFIVTDRPEEVADVIMTVVHHSATLYRAEGAYTHKPHYVIYTIIGADEVAKVRKHVRSVDSHAFINIMSSDAVTGNFYVKPIG